MVLGVLSFVFGLMQGLRVGGSCSATDPTARVYGYYEETWAGVAVLGAWMGLYSATSWLAVMLLLL
jgi:hypothetical protein